MGQNNKALQQQQGPVPYGAPPGYKPPVVNAPAAPAPNSWTNEGAVPDYLNRAVSRLEGRSDTSNTARAIDKSNAGIADSAALLAKDAKANTGSRGVLGSTTGDAYLQRNVFQPAGRAAAKAASDISQGEQTRLDNLAMGGSAILALPAQTALANQSLNLQQMQAMAQNSQAQQRLQMEREQDEMAKWMALMRMQQQQSPAAYGPAAGYSGSPGGSVSGGRTLRIG